MRPLETAFKSVDICQPFLYTFSHDKYDKILWNLSTVMKSTLLERKYQDTTRNEFLSANLKKKVKIGNSKLRYSIWNKQTFSFAWNSENFVINLWTEQYIQPI
jgi:hypothetical protein